MPRAKTKATYPVAWIDGILKLDAQTTKRLIEHAGLDPTDPDPENRQRIKGLVLGVVQVLARYQSIVEILDKRPRPANIRAALRPIQKHAKALFSTIDSLDAETWWRLKQAGWDPDITGFALSHIWKAAACVEDELGKRESRHAPRKDAARILIADLNRLYTHYNEAIREQEDTNASSSKKRFVTTALRAAKIPAGRNLVDAALRDAEANFDQPRKHGVIEPDHVSTLVIHDPSKPPDQQLTLGRYFTCQEDQVLDQLRRIGFGPQSESSSPQQPPV